MSVQTASPVKWCATGGLLLAALLALPAAADDAATPPVATVNGEAIGEGELQVMVGAILGQKKPSRRSDIDEAQELARDQLISNLAMAQAALKLGLDKDPGVAGVLAYQRAGTLARAYQREMLRRNPVTDERAAAEYARGLVDGKVQEYHIAHIVVSQRGRANELIGELKRGEKFDSLARIYSLDQTASSNSGDVGWLRVDLLDEYPFVDAVVKLKPGEYTSEPVKGANGWHIVKLVEAPRVAAGVNATFADLPKTTQEKLKQRAQLREIAQIEADVLKSASVTRAADLRVFGAVSGVAGSMTETPPAIPATPAPPAKP